MILKSDMPYTNVNYRKLCKKKNSEKQIKMELFNLTSVCVFSVNCGHRPIPPWWTGQWYGWYHPELPSREHAGRRGRRWTATGRDRHVFWKAGRCRLFWAWLHLCIRPHCILARHQSSHSAGELHAFSHRQKLQKTKQNCLLLFHL